MSRSRGWCFTCNNYDEDDVLAWFDEKYEYLVFGYEIGENGTKHLQGYVFFKNARTMSSLKKKHRKEHFEPAKGNPKQNRDYCTKGGNFEERGDLPKQGKRTDLDGIKQDIVDGKTVDEICLENPEIYHQYGRTLNKLEDIVLRSKHRTWMTKGIWYHGPTGVGKSHKAFEGYDPSTHYVWKDDNGWQDGYTGQETVIINDFRGSIRYDQMLQMIDKYPYYVSRRGREPAPFLAKTVIITSSLSPEEVYCNRMQSDSIEQLLRRVEVTEMTRMWSG